MFQTTTEAEKTYVGRVREEEGAHFSYTVARRSQIKNPTMLKKMLKWFAVFFVAVAAVFAALLFVPKDNGKAYRIKIAKN